MTAERMQLTNDVPPGSSSEAAGWTVLGTASECQILPHPNCLTRGRMCSVCIWIARSDSRSLGIITGKVIIAGDDGLM